MSYLFRGMGVVDLSSVPQSVRTQAAAAHPELIDHSIPGGTYAGMPDDFSHNAFGTSFAGNWAAPVWVPDVQDMLDYQAMYRAEQNPNDTATLQAANAAAGADAMRGYVCNPEQTVCAHTQAALAGVNAPNPSAGTPVSVAVAPAVSVQPLPTSSIPFGPAITSTPPAATHPTASAPPAQSQVVSSTPGSSIAAPEAGPVSGTVAGFDLSSVPLWGWLAGGAVLAYLLWPKGGR